MQTTEKVSTTANSTTKGIPGIQAKKGGKLSAGAISGIVLGLLAVVAAIVVGVILFRKYNKTRSQYRHSIMVNMDEL